MKLKAIRGGNQRGISFTSLENKISETASITAGLHRVYSDLRGSDKVDSVSIVIDSRLFDELECIEGEEVTLSEVSDPIPLVDDILVEVTSLSDESHKLVTDRLSEEISEIKEELDGLIIQTGLKIQVPTKNITMEVIETCPVSSKKNRVRLSWRELGKIRLRALDEEKSIVSEKPDTFTVAEIDGILDRLLVLEERCDSLRERWKNQTGKRNTISLEHVEKRLNEALFRLEEIFSRLSGLEKRLDKIVDSIRG